MRIQPKRPPGRKDRKAAAYAADIVALRSAGYTYEAIREGLADLDIHLSTSALRREVRRSRTQAVAQAQPSATSPDSASVSVSASAASAASAPAAPADPHVRPATRGKTVRPAMPPDPASDAPLLPGKGIAAAFMRGRPTNTLYLEES